MQICLTPGRETENLFGVALGYPTSTRQSFVNHHDYLEVTTVLRTYYNVIILFIGMSRSPSPTGTGADGSSRAPDPTGELNLMCVCVIVNCIVVQAYQEVCGHLLHFC